MPVTVRPAVAADQQLIVAWNDALARETEGKSLDPSALSEGVRRVLADPSLGRYFIAEIDGQPVGQMMLTWEWSDWRNGMFWWIQSVYVAPEHRGTGVFSLLYRHIHKLALETSGVCGLRLYVDQENQHAADIYRALGMRDAQYDMLEIDFQLADKT
jgi:GNAT superfamily N-acetyltransferase